jgi:hypothetical protein
VPTSRVALSIMGTPGRRVPGRELKRIGDGLTDLAPAVVAPARRGKRPNDPLERGDRNTECRYQRNGMYVGGERVAGPSLTSGQQPQGEPVGLGGRRLGAATGRAAMSAVDLSEDEMGTGRQPVKPAVQKHSPQRVKGCALCRAPPCTWHQISAGSTAVTRMDCNAGASGQPSRAFACTDWPVRVWCEGAVASLRSESCTEFC